MIKPIIILILCLPIIGLSQVIHTIDAILCYEPNTEITDCNFIYETQMHKRLKLNKYKMPTQLRKDQHEIPKKLNAINYNVSLSGLLKFEHLVFYDPNISLTQSYKRGIILSNVIFSSSINYNKYCCNSDEQYKFFNENGIKLKRSMFEIGYNLSCLEIVSKNSLFGPEEKYCKPATTTITKVKLFGELIFFKNCDIEVLNLDRQEINDPYTINFKDVPIYFFSNIDSIQYISRKDINHNYISVKKNVWEIDGQKKLHFKGKVKRKLFMNKKGYRPQMTYLPMGKYFKE